MKVAVMQPYLFPYLGYFQLIHAADRFVVFDDVNYINKGWINRNNLLVNGAATLFTVPLRDAGQNKKINDIELSPDTAWRAKLLKTVEFNYKKTPLFGTVFPLLQQVFYGPHIHIAALNLHALRMVCGYLGIDTEIVPSSDIYGNAALKGQERIVDICRKENADIYINPMGGVDLYDAADFARHGIELRFLKPQAVPYPQNAKTFVPWLSMIDVLMNNPREKVVEMLDKFEWT